MTAIERPQVKYTQLFINNEWLDSVSGKTFPDVDPSTEEEFCRVQEADKADVDKAVAAAKSAFKRGSPWRTMDASERGRLLYKLSELMERDSEHLTKLCSLEMGKPYSDACWEAGFAASNIRYYAGFADKIQGLTIPTDGSLFTYTRREPIGVCGFVIPWNFPLAMVAWKIGPALACGNTCVLKPAEQCPLGALYIGSLCKEAGFPPGVINIVPGYGPTAGAALCEHPDVRKLAFTGSTEVGKLIFKAGASSLKNVGLELGGKSPFIIFDDCKLPEAVAVAVGHAMYNSGQVCCAPTRTFVQEGIYDKFVDMAVKDAKARLSTVGDPFNSGTVQGPQVDEEQFHRILKLIETGKKEGARLQCGGCREGNEGYFIQPTVFSDCKDNMTIATDEIFGPCMQIFKFKTMEEVIERANDTPYGLAAGVFTSDSDKAVVVSHALEAGTVWVNTWGDIKSQSPFGGYKESGIGRELGEDGLHEYTEVKTVSMKISIKTS